MSDNIVSITFDNAQSHLIDESFKRPVLIDFWADWCAPCKNLMPILEKLADEYAGQFLLAKVNSDSMNMIASQFGVRSLPTVVLMKDGQPVDGFTGAQPEGIVRKLLEKYLPKPWDTQFDSAMALVEEEKFKEAAPLLKQAWDASSMRADIGIEYANVLAQLKRFDDADEALKTVKMIDQDDRFRQVQAQLELAREAGHSPELRALEASYRKDPDNLELAAQLAVQYAQSDYAKHALELLYPLLRKNINALDGELKKSYMDILASLGKGDPLAAEYQRKLFTLLY